LNKLGIQFNIFPLKEPKNKLFLNQNKRQSIKYRVYFSRTN